MALGGPSLSEACAKLGRRKHSRSAQGVWDTCYPTSLERENVVGGRSPAALGGRNL